MAFQQLLSEKKSRDGFFGPCEWYKEAYKLKVYASLRFIIRMACQKPYL